MKFATSSSISFACIIAALSLTAHPVDGMNERQEAGTTRNNRKKERKLIIGGEDAPTDGSNLYPWFTLMMTSNGGGLDLFGLGDWTWAGCGGVLVSPEYVLTDAFCVDGPGGGGVADANGVFVGALCPNEENNCGQVSDLVLEIALLIYDDSILSIHSSNSFAFFSSHSVQFNLLTKYSSTLILTFLMDQIIILLW